MDNSTAKLINSESDKSNHSDKSVDSFTMTSNQRVILNVGGFNHEVLRKTLDKIPNSRLGRLIHAENKEELLGLCDDFNMDKSEYFFDRDPTLFNFIVNYYRIGKLHLNDDICPIALSIELDYWDIDEPIMDLCCEEKLFKKQKDIDHSTEMYLKIEKEEKSNMMEEIRATSNKYRKLKHKVWNMVDTPFEAHSILIAKVILSDI